MAISSLNANQIINIASDFAHIYNLKKEEEEEIKKILIEYGLKKILHFSIHCESKKLHYQK